MSTKLVIERGTDTRKVERIFTVWAGEPFLEYQKKKMKAIPHDWKISMKRGTECIKVSEYPYVPKKYHQADLSSVLEEVRASAFSNFCSLYKF